MANYIHCCHNLRVVLLGSVLAAVERSYQGRIHTYKETLKETICTSLRYS